jgi:hypothetical protein
MSLLVVIAAVLAAAYGFAAIVLYYGFKNWSAV